MSLSLPFTVHALIDELPLPLSGRTRELDALVVGMILESEFGLILADEELTPDALGDRRRILAVLARHGVTG
jgi:hypothetical protein